MNVFILTKTVTAWNHTKILGVYKELESAEEKAQQLVNDFNLKFPNHKINSRSEINHSELNMASYVTEGNDIIQCKNIWYTNNDNVSIRIEEFQVEC